MACQGMSRLLPAMPEGVPLEHFLPETTPNKPYQGLEPRATLASTLLAGLEMGTDGTSYALPRA